MRLRWGLRAPRPAPGDFAPWTHLGEHTSWEEKTILAIRAGVYEKFEGFWPKKAGEILRGK